MLASDLQRVDGKDVSRAPRLNWSAIRQRIRDATPGALMGAGGAIANSQAGWLSPQMLWFVIPTVAGAALSALALRFAKTRASQQFVTYATVAISLGLLFLAHKPNPHSPVDDKAEVASSSAAAIGEVESDVNRTEQLGDCALFQLGDWRGIMARPPDGTLGSRSNPLRFEATTRPVALEIESERDQPWEFAQLNAAVVGVPLLTRDFAFSEKSLKFEGRTIQIDSLRIDDGNFFTGLDIYADDEPIPIPLGVIELTGGFSDTERLDDSDAATGDTCPFLIHLQLVSPAWSSLPGKAAVLALIAGALAILFRLRDAFRKPSQGQRQPNDAPPAEPASESPPDSELEVPDFDQPTESRGSATTAPPRTDLTAGDETSQADDRRLGVEAFMDRKKLPGALVADSEATIKVSIAGPDVSIEQLTAPANVEFGDFDYLELPVKFVDHGDGVEQWQEMTLERDPTKPGEVKFAVTPTGTRFSALVAVFTEDRSRVIQAATLTADVLPSRAEADAVPSSFRLTSCINVTSMSAAAIDDSDTASLVHDDNMAIGSGDYVAIADVAQAIAIIKKVTSGLVESAKTRIAHGTSDHIHETLVGAAIAGYLMRTRLRLAQFDPVERIQVVSMQSQSVLPLELVYQAESPPDVGAPLCTDWSEPSGCECATRPAAEQRQLVCPSLFWGISKVVEHHVAHERSDTTAAESSFTVHELQEPHSTPLRVPVDALVGMSERVVRVAEEQAGSLAGMPEGTVSETILRQIKKGAPGLGATAVPNWATWKSSVEGGKHDLLIAMPHNDERDIGGISFEALEIGGTHEQAIERHHVVAAGHEPPIVMLIGCNTGVEEEALASFAAQFQDHSRLVVATVGEILAQEAPFVVAMLMYHLRLHGERPDGTIGAAVRDARQTLLGQGFLAGLQLVVHGDGTWPLTSAPTAAPTLGG